MLTTFAGCAGEAVATPDQPDVVELSDNAPDDIRVFKVFVEGQEYTCFEVVRNGFHSGHYGLSCTPTGNESA